MSLPGSKAVLLTQLGRLKSVSAIPPIPGMTVLYRSTYAKCHFLPSCVMHDGAGEISPTCPHGITFRVVTSGGA
jgi:hypothetical protein